MEFSNQDRSPVKKMAGLGIAVVFHVGLIYALMVGLGIRPPLAPYTDGTIDLLPPVEKPVEPTKVVEYDAKPIKPSYVFPPEEFPDSQNDSIKDVTFQKPNGGDLVIARNDVVERIDPVRVAPVVDARTCAKPEYPARSIRDEVQGTTELQFLIGVDGKVMDSKIAKSSGSRDLDSAALAGLGHCAFKVGTVDGKPQPSWTKIQYVWKLD